MEESKPESVALVTSLLFPSKVSVPKTRWDEDAVHYRRLYGVEPKGRRLSMVPGNYLKHGPGKSGKRSPLVPDASIVLHHRTEKKEKKAHTGLRAAASTAIRRCGHCAPLSSSFGHFEREVAAVFIYVPL